MNTTTSLTVLLSLFAQVTYADITRNTKPFTPSLYRAPVFPSGVRPSPTPRVVVASGTVKIEKCGTLPVEVQFGGAMIKGYAYALDIRVKGATNEVTVHLRMVHNSESPLPILQEIEAFLKKAEKQQILLTFYGFSAKDRLFFNRIEGNGQMVELLRQ